MNGWLWHHTMPDRRLLKNTAESRPIVKHRIMLSGYSGSGNSFHNRHNRTERSPAMDKKITDLIAILRKECETHDTLIEVATAMNTALRENDTGAIQRNSVQYDETTCAIENLEEQRLQLCDSIGRGLKKQRRHLNCAAIADILPPQDAGPLRKIRQELKDKINTLTKINTSNQVLLEDALAGIARAVKLLANEKRKYSGYRRFGAKDPEFVPKNIVNKVA
ncbi:MAG: hypothetical protein GF350_10050 [Chitinivibrionales bacterium]|nr:hypothetical protein [Chitinivibrionales bacterium]